MLKKGCLHKELAVNLKAYLVQNGFAYRRYDVDDYVKDRKDTNTNHIELTPKGRNLKIYGSIEVYNRKQEEKKVKQEAAERAQRTTEQRNLYLYWINLSIGIATGVAALYYTLEILKSLAVFYYLLPFWILIVSGSIMGLLAYTIHSKLNKPKERN